MTVWARVLKEQKVLNDLIYSSEKESFEQMLRNICQKLDLPTPLVLEKHKKQFKMFGQAKFISEEFVESVDLDRLIIENVTDKK